MKKLEFGQTFNLLANLGVLVGLLLLVFELSQTRQMMEAQTRHELSQGIIDQGIAVATDRELAELIEKAQTGKLNSRAEEIQWNWWLIARVRYWEDVHYQYRLGLFDQAEFESQLKSFAENFERPEMSEWWSRRKFGYSPDFVSAMDELISDNTSE